MIVLLPPWAMAPMYLFFQKLSNSHISNQTLLEKFHTAKINEALKIAEQMILQFITVTAC